MQGLLPLGTVAKLKNSPSTIMIIGYFPMDKNNHIYNYMGVNYPFGIGISNETIMFDESSIDNLLYIGYQDIKAKEYCKLLETLIIECTMAAKTDSENIEVPKNTL